MILWWLICAMSYKRVFFGRKCKRSPRENPPNDDFGGFSHGDLSLRQAKIRQTVAENATSGMSRTFVWRGERSLCENTKKSPFGGFSRCAFSHFRPDNTHIYAATIVISIVHTLKVTMILMYAATERSTKVAFASLEKRT